VTIDLFFAPWRGGGCKDQVGLRGSFKISFRYSEGILHEDLRDLELEPYLCL